MEIPDHFFIGVLLVVLVFINPSITGFQDVTVKFDWNEYKNPSNSGENRFSYGGGIRIAEITNYDQAGNIISRRSFDYNYRQDTDGDGAIETHSYGRRMSSPFYTRNEVAYII